MMQLVVNQEERLLAVEGNVRQLVAVRAEAAQALQAADRSPEPAPDKPLRAKINELVRLYCRRTATKFEDAWGRLYKEVYYRCQFNAQERSKHSGRMKLDEIEEAGLLPDLWAIASEVLTP
jgi:hypothetical protein